MLGNALKHILPHGVYPENITEYLEWDDCRVIQLLKENAANNDACYNIINRIVYPRVDYTKTHPGEADKREFRRNEKELKDKIGEEFFIKDTSAGKMPHKIPMRVEIDEEKAIVIYNSKSGRKTTISEESEIIKSLSEKIDIMSLYCHPDKSTEAYEIIKKINEV